MSQSFIIPDFPEIVKRRIERYPGGYTRVANAMNITRMALYNKVKARAPFKSTELAILDSIFHFTNEEKETIWR